MLRTPLALAFAMVTMLTARAAAQSVPPSVGSRDTSAPVATPASDRCDVARAAISLVGRVPSFRSEDTVGSVRLLDRDAGLFIARSVPEDFETRKILRDGSPDGSVTAHALLEIDRRRLARAAADASPERMMAELERLREQTASLSPAYRRAKQMRVGPSGAFRCDGVVPGSYELIATLRQRVVVTTHTPVPGLYGTLTRIYAVTVVVPEPERGRHLTVAVPRLNLLGVDDPNR